MSRYSTGFSSKLSASTKCCAYRPTRSACDRRWSPVVGVRSPASRFMSVVFPAPLGPTMATREPASTPMLSPASAKSSRPGYWKPASVSCSRDAVGRAVGGGNLKVTV